MKTDNPVDEAWVDWLVKFRPSVPPGEWTRLSLEIAFYAGVLAGAQVEERAALDALQAHLKRVAIAKATAA